MTGSDGVVLEITPQVLLKAYGCGIFPMADSADDPSLFWIEPEMRGIIPLDNFHIPRSLRKFLRQNPFEIRVDHNFEAMINLCAKSTNTRRKTWISNRIIDLYCQLHEIGHCHSVEAWLDGALVGGLYGVSLGKAFFGESMVSQVANASKVALCHLVHRLNAGGYILLDSQFTTQHLERFGAINIPRAEYHERLAQAMEGFGKFYPDDYSEGGGTTSESILQSFSQMS